MDDNCGEWVKCTCICVASGCGEQEAGVASGSGCKEVYKFSHITYPYSSCICSFFCSSIPTFCSFLNIFFVLLCI